MLRCGTNSPSSFYYKVILENAPRHKLVGAFYVLKCVAIKDMASPFHYGTLNKTTTMDIY
jgi:hypothetical protein